MAKVIDIHEKVEEEKFEEPIGDNVDNKLELLKFTSEVQSRIKNDVSSDFVLAKLDEKDKEGITEMTVNAYFCKKIAELIRKSASARGEYDFDGEKWVRKSYSKQYLDKITEMGNSTFDTFMTKIYMTVLLNRNVPKNHLLKMLAQYNEEEDEEAMEVSVKDKVKRVIANEETSEKKV